jgi:hypothetical protein
MKKKHIAKTVILFFTVIFISCSRKEIEVSNKHILGLWIIKISDADRQRMKTGMQKFFFLFKKNKIGSFYYYNVDFSTGTQYARKDKRFKYRLKKEVIEITWEDDNSVVNWPYTFYKNNSELVISDPSPGGQTYALERTTE